MEMEVGRWEAACYSGQCGPVPGDRHSRWSEPRTLLTFLLTLSFSDLGVGWKQPPSVCQSGPADLAARTNSPNWACVPPPLSVQGDTSLSVETF